MTDVIPNYQDRVKNKLNETTGVVIAKYVLNGVTYLDVRSDEERIYEKTPATNWTTVMTEEQSWE